METSSNFVEENSDDNSDDFLIIFEWNDLEKLRESTRIFLRFIIDLIKIKIIFNLRFDFPHSKISLESFFFFFLKNP